MSMPPPPGQRSGVSTRPGNRNAHPGIKAGLAVENAPHRRSKQEMEAAAAQEARERAAKEKAAAAGVARVAELEDKNRRLDQTRRKEARDKAPAKPTPKATPTVSAKPPVVPKPRQATPPSTAPSRTPSPPAEENAGRAGGDEDANSTASSPRPGNGDSDDYMDEDPPPHDESSDDEPEIVVKPAKKAPVVARADVHAQRRTKDTTGTPTIEQPQKRRASDAQAPAAKKARAGAKLSGFAPPPKKKSPVPVPDADAELGSRSGGYALDDDDGEEAEHPAKKVSMGKRMGKPKVVAVRVTQKSLRDGDDRWHFSHAPCSEHTLKYDFLPLMKDTYGVLHPWENPTTQHVQGGLDPVFGRRKYVAKTGEVWMGLVANGVTAWRRQKVDAAKEAFEGLIAFNWEEKKRRKTENAEIRAAREARDERRENGEPPLEGDDDDTAFEELPEPQFDLTTKQGIADMVEDQLSIAPGEPVGKTRVFHWETITETDKGTRKRGFFTTALILQTFASHLTALDAIPAQYADARSDEPHYGALLLSVQAVEFVLRAWATGEWVTPSRANAFSFENWGDIPGTVNEHRASTFLPTLKGWSPEMWGKFMERASEWKALPKKKRRSSRASSAASSEAAMSEEYTPAPAFIVVDDDDDE
uniref:Uncharacterized protein n=1 Tax=Mycena chlorophos TaxID=658473 RepID=A0ABQ0L1P4_MYCCL|nr:predicted protein [Mycena chlorophos]